MTKATQLKLILLLVASLVVSACSPPRKAVVIERTTITEREETERIGGNLIRFVQPGDTLHSIAFVNNLNVNDIAAWNGVRDTSRLLVGQRIRLTKPIGFVAKPKPRATSTKPAVVVERVPAKRAPPRSSPQNTNKPAKPPARRSSVSGTGAVSWKWPTKGSVIKKFSVPQGQQGIDIKAPLGQPVLAASTGEVVYVGNGLKGYGNLVIVKHNDRFLSAYAHNRETFVREGERVSTQQKIGSVGVNRSGQTALHFQIRENGKPVNPLSYL